MKALAAIVWKDIVIELRNKESVSSMITFGVMVVVLMSFTLDPGARGGLRAGILWIAFSFASVIGLNRSLAMELDNECLQGLLLAPLSRDALYIAKVASNLTFMLIANFIVMGAFCVFNNVGLDADLLKVCGFAVIGSLGFSAVGTILSTIAAGTRMREVMLSILQIPLTLPLVVIGAEATGAVFEEFPERIPSLLGVLSGFTIVYLVVSYMIFEYAVEE